MQERTKGGLQLTHHEKLRPQSNNSQRTNIHPTTRRVNLEVDSPVESSDETTASANTLIAACETSTGRAIQPSYDRLLAHKNGRIINVCHSNLLCFGGNLLHISR